MSRHEKIILSALFAAALLSLPFSLKTSSRALIALSLVHLWLYFKYRPPRGEGMVGFFWSNAFFSAIFLIGFANTSNLPAALRLLETRSCMIAFPMFFLMAGTYWKKDMIIGLLCCFAWTIVLSGIAIHFGLLVDMISEGRSLSDFFHWRTGSFSLSKRIHVHPTYLSMYALFSMGILYEFYLTKKTSPVLRLLTMIALPYLAVLTLHLASRVSFVVLLGVVITLLVDSFRKYGLRLAFLMIPLAIGAIWLFSSEGFAIKSRLENKSGLSPSLFTGGQVPTDSSSQGQRVFAWYSSIAVLKNNYWIGVGSGDVIDALNDVYKNMHAETLAKKELNSHNQFLDSVIRNGVAGLIALILLYFYPFLEFGKQRLYLIFLLIIIATSLTENILERQHGAFFFVAFNMLLYRYYQEDRPQLPDGHAPG